MLASKGTNQHSGLDEENKKLGIYMPPLLVPYHRAWFSSETFS
jgi:hypothetical protein